MTTYTTVSGIKQLLDTELWEEENLNEQIITLAPTTTAWVNMQISRDTDFTEVELLGEPIIVLASNCYTCYVLQSTQLEGHNLDTHSLAMIRLENAKDYLRGYCLRNGITPMFDAVDVTVSGTVDFAVAYGTDGGCI